MENNNFKIILVALFAGFAILAVLVFAGVINIGGDNNSEQQIKGTLTMWGTIPQESVKKALEEFSRTNREVSITYSRKNPDTFSAELLEAIATGRTPDLFLLTNDLVLDYANKIYPTLYTEFPIYAFDSNFVASGKVFATSKGILAFPLLVDPLMMYYNRSLLESENIISPPEYWEDFIELTTKINRQNESKEITRSLVAMGQFNNVNNAKEIILSLLMQTGNPILEEKNGIFLSVLSENNTRSKISELASAIDFYVNFTNPLDRWYSWNRTMPEAREFFVAQKSAFYFGFASELNTLMNKNPNLNFSVTSIPQFKDSNYKNTYARVTGVAVSLSTRKNALAKNTAISMASSNFSKVLSEELNMAPANKSFLSDINPDNPFLPIFYNSALFSKSWLDPSYEGTNNIFRSMIEKMLSNTIVSTEAVNDVNNRLNLLILE